MEIYYCPRHWRKTQFQTCCYKHNQQGSKLVQA